MINIFTKWIDTWRNNGWKTKTGIVKNLEIIKEIDKDNRNIMFVHVKAHTTNMDMDSIGNRRADELANEGCKITHKKIDQVKDIQIYLLYKIVQTYW